MSKGIVDQPRDPLEDLGWQRMRVLLDQEMPEKRKRAVWWPWIGMAATLGAFVLWHHFTSVSLPETSKPLQELTTTGSAGQEAIASAQPLQEENDGDRLLATTDSPVVTDSRRSEDGGNLEAGDRIRQNPAGEVTGARNNAGKFGKEMPVDIADPPAGMVTPSELSGWSDQITTPANRESFEVFPSLPDRILSTLDHKYPAESTSSKVSSSDDFKIESEPMSRIDVAVNLGMLTAGSEPGFSYDLGGNIRYKPSRKVALGLGANIWSVGANQDFTATAPPTSAIADNRNLTLAAADQADAPGTPVAGVNTYSGSVDHLSYLRIPLYVQLFPESRWQPYVGLNQVILLAEGSGGIFTRESHDFSISQGRPIDDLVRKSNTSWMAGISWSPTGQLKVDLSMARAGKSYLNYEVSQGTYAEYHNFWRLALAYRF
jgi:hypothetical protein